MNIEKFLSFWSHYNTAIIESLVALIVILSLFLAYRSFFTKKAISEDAGLGGTAADTQEIEKTLQKILENQGKAVPVVSGESSEQVAKLHSQLTESLKKISVLETRLQESQAAALAGAGAGEKDSSIEVSQLRSNLTESERKIAALQEQLATAQASGSAPAAPSEDLLGKIADLEARLAEYEIISEDIADLTKFREENDRLRSELAAAKSGGVAPSAAPSAAPAAATEPPAASSESSDLIDDELMREFAAAVEGQKSAAIEEKAGSGSAAAKGEDTEKLMNEFENFVSKKS